MLEILGARLHTISDQIKKLKSQLIKSQNTQFPGAPPNKEYKK